VAASILVATDLDALASFRLGLDAAALAVIYGGDSRLARNGFPTPPPGLNLHPQLRAPSAYSGAKSKFACR
jgi:hypothetical protein